MVNRHVSVTSSPGHVTFFDIILCAQDVFIYLIILSQLFTRFLRFCVHCTLCFLLKLTMSLSHMSYQWWLLIFFFSIIWKKWSEAPFNKIKTGHFSNPIQKLSNKATPVRHVYVCLCSGVLLLLQLRLFLGCFISCQTYKFHASPLP